MKGLDNPLVFSEHDFAAAKAIDHDVVGDETENNSANPQTLVVVNQHINLPEEPELMANVFMASLLEFFFILNHCLKQHNVRKKDKAKKPKSIKSRPNNPFESTSKDGVIRCLACEERYCDPPTQEWIQYCKCQEWCHEECSNYENGIFICDYC
ncbi:uncharacterized protein TNCV_2837691 [Trichonephila clavipes]|nr:uncharacterized protein TNCV_2837691 [Trichonephila clavipes]